MDRILTIGYEGATINDFVASLVDLEVTTLLDIRELAMSRKKGFAKTALREHLSAVGIAYRHERELGSPRDIRNKVREVGDYQAFFRAFDQHLLKQEALLATLARDLEGAVALLCYERNHRECHRSSVATALERLTGLTATHHEVAAGRG